MKFYVRSYLMLCISVVMLLWTAPASYAYVLPAYDSNDPLLDHPWEMGTEIGYIRYREPSLGVEFKGMVYGINGTYNYRIPDYETFSSYLNGRNAFLS